MEMEPSTWYSSRDTHPSFDPTHWRLTSQPCLCSNHHSTWAHFKKKFTILLAFFPYLAQIIISIRGCVACNDLWPWPIFSRSFSLDLENRVHSVASTVLHGFFPYLVQMITSLRRCVTCDDLWPWPISPILLTFFPYFFDLGSDMNQ